MGVTDELHARPKRVRKSPTYPAMPLTAASTDPDPLARVRAWAKEQVQLDHPVAPPVPRARAAAASTTSERVR